jgi:hypothetical protein
MACLSVELAVVIPREGLHKRADGKHRCDRLEGPREDGGDRGSAAFLGAQERELHESVDQAVERVVREGNQVRIEEGEDEEHCADDQAADCGGERIGTQALLHHAEAANSDGAHQEPCARERVRAHCDILKLELAHEHRGSGRRVLIESASEDTVESKEGEEGRAQLDEETTDRHDHVQPFHEVDPLVPWPVDGRVGRTTSVQRCCAANNREYKE